MSTSRPYSILLVEDDAPLRRCLAELMAGRGWVVHPAGTGTEAVELARRVRLDFSILDMHLPGMSGLEVLRTISSEIKPIPSILMSGQATAKEKQAAFCLGIHAFLRKPLDLHDFRQSLDELIRRHFEPPANPQPGRGTLV